MDSHADKSSSSTNVVTDSIESAQSLGLPDAELWFLEYWWLLPILLFGIAVAWLGHLLLQSHRIRKSERSPFEPIEIGHIPNITTADNTITNPVPVEFGLSSDATTENSSEEYIGEAIRKELPSNFATSEVEKSTSIKHETPPAIPDNDLVVVLRKRISQRELRIEKLKTEVDQRNARIEALQEQSSSLIRETKELRSANDKHTKEVDSLVSRIAKQQEENTGLRRQVSDLETGLTNLKVRTEEEKSEFLANITSLKQQLELGQQFAELNQSNLKGLAKSAPTNPRIRERNASIRNHDDFRKIEGIGPKIASLLQDNEIRTFEQLADTTQERLREILAAGGARFKSRNPETWPQQAHECREENGKRSVDVRIDTGQSGTKKSTVVVASPHVDVESNRTLDANSKIESIRKKPK